MTKMAAIHNFFSGFMNKAYTAGNVPADATYPWLTYEAFNGYIGDPAQTATVQIWFHTESEKTPNDTAESFGTYIGSGGRIISCDNGAIWIKRGTPWCNSYTDPSDNTLKRRIFNVTFEFLTI